MAGFSPPLLALGPRPCPALADALGRKIDAAATPLSSYVRAGL